MSTYDDGWRTVVPRSNELSSYRRLVINDGDWFGIVVIVPDTWANNEGFAPVELFDRTQQRHDIVDGKDLVRPNKRWKIRSLDEDEIERQLREKLRVLSMRRPAAKVRA